MNLYHVQWDGGSRYVEAATFGDAVKLWREAMRDEWGDDLRPDDEPDSVALVDDQPVLRAAEGQS